MYKGKSTIEYKELSKAKIQKTRNLVISSTSKGKAKSGFTLAQQLEVEEGGKKTNVFMSGAIIIDGEQGLYNLRDALNVAIDKHEKENGGKTPASVDEEDWDNE